ncbi:hypothetical protein FHS77_002683 [Paenochrobactrum gallinarii]|uniref:DUF551 domain-containing protein n=1 Tax=Paenochrobactrum gallinarii TaxID=643673 RepID=A0A841LUU6_9HYPH|nr:hypothetical protein [Paenochrobactrum gallinarii]MBB6262115.1 hypothetical protein [Paenochrobactrum gallinarii]
MTNPVQIPDAAVQAFRQSFESTDNNCDTYQDVRKALTAALPHLSLGFEVKKLEWEKTHSCNGILSAKTHFGTYFISSNKTVRLGLTTLSCPFQLLDEAKSFAQADFECRVGECHVPRPDIKTIIDEIRAGTRQGFLNEGDQPKLSDAELSCPYCSGSGHIDDVATNPVDVAAVREQAFEEAQKSVCSGCSDEVPLNAEGYHQKGFHTSPCHAAAIRALSAEPAQGEQWQPIETAPKDGSPLILLRNKHEFAQGERVIIAHWSDKYDSFVWADFFDIYADDIDEVDENGKYVFDIFKSNDFTHWMHLPAAPALKGQQHDN